MINKPKKTIKTSGFSKFFQSITLTGGILLLILKPGIAKNNTELKAELKNILQTVPVKERKIVEPNQSIEKTAKFETLGGNDTLKDPYDQIRKYVDGQNTTYFNQLKTHMENKDSIEQIKCKAVVYAILQDPELSQEEREILALSQFEILARMPGSDYRFSKKSSELTKTDEKYKEKTLRYYAYKTYLSNLALDEEIAQLDEKNKQLDEKNKQLDEKNKQLDEKNKQLDREIQLLEQLLTAYQKK